MVPVGSRAHSAPPPAHEPRGGFASVTAEMMMGVGGAGSEGESDLVEQVVVFLDAEPHVANESAEQPELDVL